MGQQCSKKLVGPAVVTLLRPSVTVLRAGVKSLSARRRRRAARPNRTAENRRLLPVNGANSPAVGAAMMPVRFRKPTPGPKN